MKIEEYAKQFEYVVCSKADSLAEGIRIGLKAARQMAVSKEFGAPFEFDCEGFEEAIDKIMRGERDLPEVEK